MMYLLILILGALLSIWGPWWIMAAVALIICRSMAKSSKQAFWQSAFAMFTLWMAYAIYLHYGADVNMVNKMAGILTSSTEGLSQTANMLLIFGVTSFLPILIGGLAGLSGFKLKEFKMKLA